MFSVIVSTSGREKKEKAVKLAKDCWGEKNIYKVFKVYEIRILNTKCEFE